MLILVKDVERNFTYERKKNVKELHMKTNDAKLRKFNDDLSKKSGSVRSDDPLVCFLYLLMRDKMTIGDVTALTVEVSKSNEGYSFTNGHLANFAKHLAKGLHPNVNAEQSEIIT